MSSGNRESRDIVVVYLVIVGLILDFFTTWYGITQKGLVETRIIKYLLPLTGGWMWWILLESSLFLILTLAYFELKKIHWTSVLIPVLPALVLIYAGLHNCWIILLMEV